MQAAHRVFFNTIILYVKILVTMFISLYSVPLVLKALGASDYGLYNLVAGVIAMLAFLNASMTVSTQRFVSVFMGSGDQAKISAVFNVSIVLHFIIAFVIFLLFEGSSFFLFNGVLNIDPGRIEAAKIIYQFLIISMVFTILSVPFDAMINANENMLAVSLINMVDALLRLALALSLSWISYDKLVFYALGTTIVTGISAVCMAVYTKYKYADIRLNIRKSFDKKLFKEMFGFAGYNTLSGFAMISRNQGMAIVLNLFFGTIINAAYGVANQINGVLSSFSATLQKSINPQLMKSEGAQNRERMLQISFISSKFSVLILSFFALPLIIEMPYVLKLWLREFPVETIWFGRLILILSLVYQYSVGLMSAIQSVGKIKQYTITICIVLITNIPVACLLLWLGFPAYSVVMGMIFVEFVALYVRLSFARKLAGLNVALFLKQVLLPTLITMFGSFGMAAIMTVVLPPSFARLVLTTVVSIGIITCGTWFLILNQAEKQMLVNVFLSKIRRKK